MKFMHCFAALAVTFALTATPVLFEPSHIRADDDPAKSSGDSVTKAWDAYQAVQKELRAKIDAINAENKKVQDNADASDDDKKAATAKARADSRAVNGDYREKLTAARTAFNTEFAKADYTKYTSNAEMLETGLSGLVQSTRAEKPAESIKYMEALLKHCPTSNTAKAVRGWMLPAAIANTGDFAAAIKRGRELLAEVEENGKPGLLVRIGDYAAGSGDVKAATASYDEALKLIGDKGTERTDPLFRARNDAETRKKMIGNDAPNIDSKVWIGGEAKSLAALKGNVVVIDFWATWCGPCRAAMPGLDHIYKENKDKGVIALGVTRFYDYGFLPADSSNLNKGESFARGTIKEEDFNAHVTTFKERSGLSYPFVIGKADDFKAYGVSGIPHMAIIDKAGKVAMIVVGSGNDAVIATCVKNLMGADAATPEGK